MPSKACTLVVGTTGDYILWISQHRPQDVLFLTDAQVRKAAQEKAPQGDREVLADLVDHPSVIKQLARHLDKWDQFLVSVVCFDDESLALAAVLAKAANLPFTSEESVRNCRNKLQSKILWQKSGISCPAFIRLPMTEIDNFDAQVPFPCIAKPLTGSGSELVFRCDDRQELTNALNYLRAGLKSRSRHRMYATEVADILIEEYVQGDELSCDFAISGDQVEIIRTAGKVIATQGMIAGTAQGYFIPANLPKNIDILSLKNALRGAAQALNIDHVVCMADFIIRNDQIVFLELSPRPGGDCLPDLLRQSADMDILQTTINFSLHGRTEIDPKPWKPVAALRLHADCAGTLRAVDTHSLRLDSRVKDIKIHKKRGDKITLPPNDYNSWLIGHVIFEPRAGESLPLQIEQLRQKINIVMEPAANG